MLTSTLKHRINNPQKLKLMLKNFFWLKSTYQTLEFLRKSHS